MARILPFKRKLPEAALRGRGCSHRWEAADEPGFHGGKADTVSLYRCRHCGALKSVTRRNDC